MLNIAFEYICLFGLPTILATQYISLLFYEYFTHLSLFITNHKKKKIQEGTQIKSYIVLAAVVLVLTPTMYFNSCYTGYSLNWYLSKQCVFVYIVSLLVSISIFYYFYIYGAHYANNYEYSLVIPGLYPTLLFFTICTANLLNFFFLIEIVGYLYFFQFFQLIDSPHRVKSPRLSLDSCILYYWANFASSLLIAYSLCTIIIQYNTCHFADLKYFYPLKSYAFVTLFAGVLIKLASPGFHFLKVEVYKNLRISAIINFSFLSLFGYVVIFQFLWSQIFINCGDFQVFVVWVSLIFGFIVIAFSCLEINNLILFFGFSAILTSSIIILLFLV